MEPPVSVNQARSTQPRAAPGQLRRLSLTALLCLILGGLGGLLASAVARPDPARGRFIPPREPARDFRLRDQDGRWITIAQGRGKVIVLTFLYSSCRDLCPAQAADIIQAVGKLGPAAAGLLVYGVSVDPAGDTPARARAFLKKYGVYGGPVHFLVGSKSALAPVWRAYGIAPINATRAEANAAAATYDRFQHSARARAAPKPYRPPERPASPAAEEAYPDPTDLRYRGRSRHDAGLDFEHSAYVMLVDKQGEQRVGIPFEQLTPNMLARDLKLLLAER
jgi:protein SCO1/2